MNKLKTAFATLMFTAVAGPAFADVAPGPACGCSAAEALSSAGPYGAGIFAALVGAAIFLAPNRNRRS